MRATVFSQVEITQFQKQGITVYISVFCYYFYFDNLTTKLFLPIADNLWRILRHICLHKSSRHFPDSDRLKAYV